MSLHTKCANTHRRGFSLIELVVVIVIIGIISAVAIPRLSRGSRTASGTALKRDLAAMRSAIELYAAEHDGSYPDANIIEQLTGYSDPTGTQRLGVADVSQNIVYGPYLREIPPMPIGARKGKSTVYVATNATDTPPQPGNHAWWYNSVTNEIRANTANGNTDEEGVPYNTY